MIAPRIEINLKKIAHNVRTLVDLYGSNGISISGVTKAVCGNPEIAKTMTNNGIEILGDSRLCNIITMKKAGVKAKFFLLRSPMLSQAKEVVQHTEYSLNTEISVLKKLSEFALLSGHLHQVILMIEMGDLREGIMPADLDATVVQILQLKGLKLIGLGTNLACFGGIIPNDSKMLQLSTMACSIEEKFNIKLRTISGGNSANYNWFMNSTNVGRVNDLRIGESILLGCETVSRKPVPGLFTDAFEFVAEIIELKTKPSIPFGQQGQNAFGKKPLFKDKGLMRRALLGVGLQDVKVSGLKPINDIQIISGSSDHLVIDAKELNLTVGQEVRFGIDYAALLSLMTSPYVSKQIIE